MQRLIVSVVVGGIVLFGWGFVSWVVLPHHRMTTHEVPDEDEFLEFVRDQGISPRGGRAVYEIPGMEGFTKDREAHQKKLETGPSLLVFYRADRKDMFTPWPYASGFLIALVISGIVVSLIQQASLERYVSRLFFVTSLGFLLAVASRLTLWNYLGAPVDHTMAMVADDVAGFFILGIVLARLVPRPKS